MDQSESESIWISGSQTCPEVASRCQALLSEIAVSVSSENDVPLGEPRREWTLKAISEAGAILILASSSWSAEIAALEAAAIADRCRAGVAVWILDVEPSSEQQALQSLPPERVWRFPREGKSLKSLVSSRRAEVLSELVRSVAFALGRPLPRDGQFRALSDYRSAQRKRLETISLKGFGVGRHPTAAHSFPFGDLFVPPRLEWFKLPPNIESQLRQLEIQRRGQHLSPAQRVALDAERSRLLAAYGPEQIQTLDAAVEKFPRMMLLGKPGSGKSSILHYLALQTHQRDDRIAVLIKLHSIADKVQPEASLWPCILRKVRAEHESVVAAALEEWAWAGRVLLLLDGVDEVRKEERPSLLAAVERMLAEQPRLRCIVTSRLATDCWLDLNIPHMQVASLSQGEVASFVERHKRCENPANAPQQSKRLIASISSEPQLGELAKTPLLLRLLCLLDRLPQGLPVERGELYEQAVCTLLETWPANRVARRVDVSPQDLRRVLGAAAAWMHRQGHRDVERDMLLEFLAKELTPKKARTCAQLAAHCLDVASIHAGILVEVSPDRFEFLHLTFTEYLAADHYVQTDGLTDLLAVRGDSRYREIIGFAAGLLAHVKRDPVRAGGFLCQLASESPGSIEQTAHPYLPLALSCLQDGRRYPIESVEELFCAGLRAATIPLFSLTRAAEQLLTKLEVPATAPMIDACAILLHHPMDDLRVAMARFLARNTARHQRAQDLCLVLLNKRNPALAAYAALGLLRAGRWAASEPGRFLTPLAFCIHPSIGAADEVQQALQQDAELREAIEQLFQQSQPAVSTEAAQLRCLLAPDDLRLLGILHQHGHEVDVELIRRAARRSEAAALWVVDTALRERTRAGYARRGLKDILPSLFAECPTVRSRLLAHFSRPLRKASAGRERPEDGDVFAASLLLKEVATGREWAVRNRDILLAELKHLSAAGDADLEFRIAALGIEIEAPQDWLAGALKPCIAAGGRLRIWAIEQAFQHQLYDLAVAGSLSRASEQGCAAAGLLTIRQQLANPMAPRPRPIAAAIERLPATPLHDSLRALVRVDGTPDAATTLHRFLLDPPGTHPMPICWWAAAEIMSENRRSRSWPPATVCGAILALGSVSWGPPPDLQSDAPPSLARRSMRPLRDRHSMPSFLELDRRPPFEPTSQDARDLLRTTYRWFVVLSTQESCHAWFELIHLGPWLCLIVNGDRVLLDQLLADCVCEDLAVAEPARRLLMGICNKPTAKLPEGFWPDAAVSAARERILDLLCAHLQSAAAEAALNTLVEFRRHGVGGSRIAATIVTFLSRQHPLQIRWNALKHGVSRTLAAGSAERAVLDDAVLADDYPLRVGALEWAMQHKVSGIPYADRLRPVLVLPVPGPIRLHCVALWVCSDAASCEELVPALVDLLASRDPLDRRTLARAEVALRRLGGEQPGDEDVLRERFGPLEQATEADCWAACFLAEFGGQAELLQRTAAAWLDEVSACTDEGELPRRLAVRLEIGLMLLARVGLGLASEAVDRSLLARLVREGGVSDSALHFMQRLRRVSQPMLECLLPNLLRNRSGVSTEFRAWLVEFAGQDPRARMALHAALCSLSLSAPSFPEAEQQLVLCDELALIDDTFAALFVREIAARARASMSHGDRMAAVAAHPIVHRQLLGALRNKPPIDCSAIIDWVLPIEPLRADPPSPPPTLSDEVSDLLRSWLTHPDYWLRLEAGERLYRLGQRDDAVLQSLRSCLSAPLAAGFGNGIRHFVAHLLLAWGEISSTELLNSLLPILTWPARNADLSIPYVLDLLHQQQACHEPTLEAVRHARQGEPSSRWCTWAVVERILQFAPPQPEQISLLLGSLAEEPGYLYDTQRDTAYRVLGLVAPAAIADGQPTENSEVRRAPKAERQRYCYGPLAAAAVLAELPVWPEPLLDSVTATLGCAMPDLRLLESQRGQLGESQRVSLLDTLLHHRAGDSPLARLLHHACLLRYGKVAGVNLDELARSLAT